MSSSVEKSSAPQSPLSSQTIVYGGIAWSVISLLFFLLFSIRPSGEESPLWYLIGTYVLETLPFLGAALLCFKNWSSPQIASGRNVWLGIGLGMISWFIANLIFGVWELYFGLDPDVSPADLFYITFYMFLSWGMVLAVLPRRLNLEVRQWITIGAIASVGIALAVWVLFATPTTSAQPDSSVSSPNAIEQTGSEATSPATGASSEAPNLPDQNEANHAPAWAVTLQDTLSPLSKPVNFFYIVGDVFLLIIASTLLLAFWGGRFAQSWRMIAAATFSLYIADMWFKYEDAVEPSYHSGSLLEVFFVFSGVLFAIGAALEYDVSSRSRRSTRKRA
ncbi:MAG TPA: hypothetical protein V6D11_15400 [Waterburya sp.]|jgi:hypothetical protein